MEVAPGVHAPASALRIQTARGGGPGGQNVNKVNTQIQLWVRIDQLTGLAPGALDRLQKAAGRRMTDSGELQLLASNHRSQEGNRREVFLRLRELILAAQHVPRRRRPTRPSLGAKKRRLEGKHIRSQIKKQRNSLDD